MTPDREVASGGRRLTLPVVIGSVGAACVAIGYLLEAVRQRGSCDTGDMSPDTAALSVFLIIFVGGSFGVVGVCSAIVGGIRRREALTTTLRIALPALISLAGSLSILAFAGRGPSTWFQYCAT